MVFRSKNSFNRISSKGLSRGWRGTVGSPSDMNRWMPVGHEVEPIKGSRCFLEQETLTSMRSTGWLQERTLV